MRQGNRGAVYFSGDIVCMSELEERKKFRHNPLTGTFHSLPGYYDPLHRLSQFRHSDEDDMRSDTTSDRSFIVVDISEANDTPTGILPPIALSRLSSDSKVAGLLDAGRPRRFSDSDATSVGLNGSGNTLVAPSAKRFKPVPLNVNTNQQESIGSSLSWADDPAAIRLRAKTLPNEGIYPFNDLMNTSNQQEPQLPLRIDSCQIINTRKSSAGSCNSTESESSDGLFTNGGIDSVRESTDWCDGFISTGKGIFRKIGYRCPHPDKPSLKPSSPSAFGPEMNNQQYESVEYTQEAPRMPWNPFVARRLNDGDEIRIMAIHRGARRVTFPQVISSTEDVNDEDATMQPKPYFIHEKAVTEQYELVGKDQLGDGSYAVVKPAIRRANGKAVAIKQIHKRYLRTEEAKQAVDREIEIHLRLKHRHIVRLYEVYETDDFLYLVMAKATKGNLSQLMRRKRRLPESIAARLAQQIVRAVFFLHDSGVLHCDLKPENILLNDAKSPTNQDTLDTASNSPVSGRKSPISIPLDPHADVKICDLNVELCDFGLSVKVPDVRFYKWTGDVHKVPYTGTTGTTGYIAPELLQQQPYGKPVDMWSVGIVIYEMLTGYRPFYPPHACLQDAPDFSDKIWQQLPEAQDLVQHLLEPEPTKRFTAEEALSHAWFDTATFAI